MIERMKFVNIMGHIDDIERVKERYLISCDIQIEDAVIEFGKSQPVSSFSVINNYTDHLRKAEQYARLANVESAEGSYLTKGEAVEIVDRVSAAFEEETQKIADYTLQIAHYKELLSQIKPFTDLEFSIDKLKSFSFIKYRLARIPINSYKQFETYMSDNPGVLFEKSSMDNDYVYCIYFIPATLYEKVASVFASMHFEIIHITDELTGTPQQAYKTYEQKLEDLQTAIRDIEVEQSKLLREHGLGISLALRKLKELSGFKDMQRYAAKTPTDFYVMVGWMTSVDAEKLVKMTDKDEKVVIVLEDKAKNTELTPPSKLRNLPIFRPFETFIRMYGLPQYNEIDPTMFFALSYTILFGMMFGDLGQGVLLSLIGLLMLKVYNIKLGGVIAVVGVSSAFFGLLYGSIFGYENIMTPLWISPMHEISTVLITTVVFGIGLNMFAMILHIINGIKRKEWGSVLFDTNGVAGFVFYLAVLIASLCAYTGRFNITFGIVAIFIGIPLLIIMFRHPLSNILVHRKLIDGKTSDFVLELIFETFEILLSYLTNTISFVRVGAFALCHVGMMSVVLMLAGASEHSYGNPIVMLIGNIFVMAMEGLVVGIQALRLQYYEMFSRYFKGGGREFISFKQQNNL